jgi:hypothetical protein
MSRTTDLATAISQDIAYIAAQIKAGKDASFYLKRAAGYADELAGEPAAASSAAPTAAAADGGDPLLVPTEADGQEGTIAGGKLVSKAAILDATSISMVNAGNPPLAEAAPYSGQALKETLNQVISSTSAADGRDIVFSVFHDGVCVAVVHGDTSTDTGALAVQYGLPQ